MVDLPSGEELNSSLTVGARQRTGSFRIKGLATLQSDSEDAGVIHVPPALVRRLLNDEALCYRIAIDYATRICEDHRIILESILDAQAQGLEGWEADEFIMSRLAKKKAVGATKYLFSTERPFSSPLFNDPHSPYYINSGRRRVLSAEERSRLDVDALAQHVYPVIKEHLIKWDFMHISCEALAELARKSGQAATTKDTLDIFFPPDEAEFTTETRGGRSVNTFTPPTR